MISILTPSRSRPVLAHRMVTSAVKTAGCNIEIMLYLNHDDPLLAEYKKLFDPSQYIIGPNQSTSYSWNLMAEKASNDILFLVGDDCKFETKNWVQLILDAFEKYPDKIACVYPRAPSVSKYKSPHFCLHKNWINALGYFLPPQFYHWYVDTWIMEVAQRIGRHHLISEFELPIESIRDKVSSDYHSSWMKQKDKWIWDKSQRHRDSDVNTLQSIINNFK
jgi:hypothetical protein